MFLVELLRLFQTKEPSLGIFLCHTSYKLKNIADLDKAVDRTLITYGSVYKL